MSIWLDVASEFRPARISQRATPITGPVGWLQYLSKHAARGVAHYQRQGMPPGWERTGRLWGYGGEWPIAEAVEGVLTTQQFWAVRRMVRRYSIASARSRAMRPPACNTGASFGKKPAIGTRAAWGQVRAARRLLACNSRELSTVRGVSQWVPGDLFLAFALCAGWDGTLVDLAPVGGDSAVEPPVDGWTFGLGSAA